VIIKYNYQVTGNITPYAEIMALSAVLRYHHDDEGKGSP
jgi:hypothetical protein